MSHHNHLSASRQKLPTAPRAGLQSNDRIAIAMNSSSTVLVFSLTRVFGADLQTIFCRIARNAGGAIAGLCAACAPFLVSKTG